MAKKRFWLSAAVTVDLVILTVRDSRLHALIVDRGVPPYQGQEALPGGFVKEETLLQAAERELQEETGLSGVTGHLEQLRAYGDPHRDPRGRVVTVAYLALIADPPTPVAGSDAAAAKWEPTEKLLEEPTQLAFDHHQILYDGLERAGDLLETTPLATSFCSAEFTIGELRRVYEAVWGQSLDPRNFYRKVKKTTGFVVETGQSTTRDGGRPAKLYTFGGVDRLQPPILRR
jgi:8-oxo-dGTP diphosphatase